jgi:hypothetical protein
MKPVQDRASVTRELLPLEERRHQADMHVENKT